MKNTINLDEIKKEIANNKNIDTNINNKPKNSFLNDLIESLKYGITNDSTELIKEIDNKASEKLGEKTNYAIKNNDSLSNVLSLNKDYNDISDNNSYDDKLDKYNDILKNRIKKNSNNISNNNYNENNNNNVNDMLLEQVSTLVTSEFNKHTKDSIIELYAIDRIKNVLNENKDILKNPIKDIINEILNDNKLYIKKIVLEIIRDIQDKNNKKKQL